MGALADADWPTKPKDDPDLPDGLPYRGRSLWRVWVTLDADDQQRVGEWLDVGVSRVDILARLREVGKRFDSNGSRPFFDYLQKVRPWEA